MPLLPSVASSMHGAVVPIAYATSAGSTSSIQFTSIPQGYQDLMIVSSARAGNAVSGASAYILINNNTSVNRSVTLLNGDGSSATSARYTGSTYEFVFSIPGASSTSGLFSSAISHILNYANATTYKNILTRNALDQNGSGAVQLTCNLLLSTSAVTSLNIINDGSNNWAAGSTFALYGIRTIGQ
jgi:hypothetical protein